MAMPISAAGQALGLGGMAGITGMAGLGDAMETEEERERRLAQIAQQRALLTQNSSPAASSLFGGIGGFNGTGLIRYVWPAIAAGDTGKSAILGAMACSQHLQAADTQATLTQMAERPRKAIDEYCLPAKSVVGGEAIGTDHFQPR
jgi:hypothetical protein